MSPTLNIATATARVADLHQTAAAARLAGGGPRVERARRSPRLLVAQLARVTR